MQIRLDTVEYQFFKNRHVNYNDNIAKTFHTHLPKLCANLIAALTSLKMKNFSHVKDSAFLIWQQRSGGAAFAYQQSMQVVPMDELACSDLSMTAIPQIIFYLCIYVSRILRFRFEPWSQLMENEFSPRTHIVSD
jgi:hypothetical protein